VVLPPGLHLFRVAQPLEQLDFLLGDGKGVLEAKLGEELGRLGLGVVARDGVEILVDEVNVLDDRDEAVGGAMDAHNLGVGGALAEVDGKLAVVARGGRVDGIHGDECGTLESGVRPLGGRAVDGPGGVEAGAAAASKGREEGSCGAHCV
jgi:hypothetical protein